MKARNRLPVKLCTLTAILLFFCTMATAQTDDVYTGSPVPDSTQKRKRERNDDWKEKMIYGGDLQLQFGTFTFVYLAPTIGYRPIDDLSFGVGAIYNYVSLDYGSGRFTRSVFGGHSYARYFFIDGVFLQAQYDKLRQPDAYSPNPNAKTWVDYLLVGGGFQSMVGKKAGITSSIMYNLTPNRLSIYPSRIVLQFGFVAGF